MRDRVVEVAQQLFMQFNNVVQVSIDGRSEIQ
jgi:hypothetical protein